MSGTLIVESFHARFLSIGVVIESNWIVTSRKRGVFLAVSSMKNIKSSEMDGLCCDFFIRNGWPSF